MTAQQKAAAGRFPRAERLDAEGMVRAHMSLRMTDWAIRHLPADQVGPWVDLAEQRLG